MATTQQRQAITPQGPIDDKETNLAEDELTTTVADDNNNSSCVL